MQSSPASSLLGPNILNTLKLGTRGFYMQLKWNMTVERRVT
jgi:hypothetical protein